MNPPSAAVLQAKAIMDTISGDFLIFVKLRARH
jgi:hypothetical protein